MKTLLGNIMIGDCIKSMQILPAGIVNTCITSPPYFGLRDYGNDGQIGLESTPEEYITKLVEVFREVKRVLTDDGTLWLNLGDSYASYKDGKAVPDTARGESNGTAVAKGLARNRMASTFSGSGIKHKDLIGIPWMVAFALRADGWHLRQDIIWHKPNPMPESVKDRCTKSHEYIFLLSKSPRYYFDSKAICEPAIYAGDNRGARGDKRRGTECNSMSGITGETRNKRSVWTVTTKPFKSAHFATYPWDLIEPCILAGAPRGGIVLDPFFGAGTTGLVAEKHGRTWIGCELNPEYAEIASARILEGRK